MAVPRSSADRDLLELPNHARREPSLLSLRELAERWSVNIKTLYGMVERGELPTVRIGRLVKVSLLIVETMEQGRATSGG